MRLTASPTVLIFSASSSGMSILNSVSNAITNSTWSRESAPRSSVIDASGVTSDSSTPSCSTMIFFTLSKVVASVAMSLPKRFRRRSHQESAVDDDRLTSNIACGVRAQEHDHAAYVVNRAEATEGDRREILSANVARQRLRHSGLD